MNVHAFFYAKKGELHKLNNNVIPFIRNLSYTINNE